MNFIIENKPFNDIIDVEISKGNENTDPYEIGDWILVEHGRWTRGFEVEMDDGTVDTMRTVESESVLGWQSEVPENTLFGDKSGAEKSTVRPEDFGAKQVVGARTSVGANLFCANKFLAPHNCFAPIFAAPIKCRTTYFQHDKHWQP